MKLGARIESARRQGLPRTYVDDLVTLTQRFESVLVMASRQRAARSSLTSTGELEWVQFEREALAAAVSHECKRRGREPVPEQTLRKIEDSAVGHSDYAYKFALRAAQEVLG